MQTKIYADSGAYASVGEAVILRSVSFGGGPYAIPNADLHAYGVYTNNVPACAMRGFGNPAVSFAAEMQINRLAEKLNLDPFEVRLKNVLEEGLPTTTGERIKSSVGIKSCLLAVKKALEKDVKILPIDSEHSAIFQCIAGSRIEDLDRIFLTGSGGPFLNRSVEEFAEIKPEDALNHPIWQMGRKISIDSATMMNKGLEVLEAKSLFGVSHDKIEVLIQPQSMIHSMVSFKDGSVMAQLGIPDMKGAIAYAMSYPERLPLYQGLPDFAGIGALTFQEPDLEKFPCLALAYEACEIGKTLPAVLNAANEEAVNAFLSRRVSFTRIHEIIAETMNHHKVVTNPTLSDIIETDKWARKIAGELITSS